MIETQECATGQNGDYPWDEFDPVVYFKYNYAKQLRHDDRQILHTVRDFFNETITADPLPRRARGIDVGTGSNLYPALTMLPFCETVTLYEYSTSNVKWLNTQQECRWPSWDQAWHIYWQQLRRRKAYRRMRKPHVELCKRVEIMEGSVFDLPDEKWDLGTMFFVAESITGERKEFHAAVDKFFGVLNHRSPFAMAFMEHSKGYHVGGQQFPATDIDKFGIEECLRARASDVTVRRVQSGDRPLRDGYSGMLVAHGRVKKRTVSAVGGVG